MRLMLSAQLVSIPSVHGPTSPTPTSVIDGSLARMALANSLCFSWYFASGM